MQDKIYKRREVSYDETYCMEQFGDEVLAATCDDLNRALAEGKGLDELLQDCNYAIMLKMTTFATEAETEEAAKMY